MQTQSRLILATRNAHKTGEIRAMIGGAFEVLDVTSFPECPEIEETGCTFLENATLKAVGISRVLEGWVLSDDSGLEVDALGGAPGVWSSSFGGEEGNHALNNATLLEKMAGRQDRSARFRCTMVLAQGGSVRAHFSGVVDGTIIDQACGLKGFGYDPLFIPVGHHQTFAELGEEVKNTLSHRFRALVQVIAYLTGQDHGHPPERAV
jgi:XTP/dITP diphosphohydrolase